MSGLIQCISPIDGSVYAERQAQTWNEAKQVCEKVRIAQKEWQETSIQKRIELVMAGVKAVGSMNDEIVPELAWQMGRPIRYKGEFSGFNERATYMAEIAIDVLKDIEISDDDKFLKIIKRIPHGVVFVIAPWNYPYMTAINTVAPALIAGNSVLLKHSSQTLLVGERIAQAFHSAGVPTDVFQNVFFSHETTSKLIASGYFDYINFTGSVEAGKSIEQSAAGTFTGIGLELGGKDPAYVMEDSDIDVAVETLIDGAMFNSGQCCCGIERIYVIESLYDDFVEKSISIVQAYKLGNPLELETTLGPMAHKRFADEVRAQLNEAISDGAITHIDKFIEDDGGTYVTPQILTNVSHEMRIMCDETFGPTVGIMKVKGDKEAIQYMNDSSFGLTASLWTKDVLRAEKIGDKIETGTVFLNRCDYVDPSLCWTGCKDTGRGGGLSLIGYHNLTRPKSFHLKRVTK